MEHIDFTILTDREKEVLLHIAEGKKNIEIEKILSISVRTVEKHRSNISNKLGLACAAQLVLCAKDYKVMIQKRNL